MAEMVKCIKIDAKNKSINYVNLEIEKEGRGRAAYPLGYKKGYSIYHEKLKRNESVVIYFKDGSIDDPKKIPNYGFLYWSDALHGTNLDKKFEHHSASYQIVVGDALIVTYKDKRFKSKSTESTPIDTKLSLKDAARLVPEYTNGIERKLPDFTCLINERFSQSGYEILLRLENEDEMNSIMKELNEPIRNLSPQMLTFSFAYRELTIMTGKIYDLDDKVQVSIIESDRADLRCVAACTLAANKIPNWIKGRLRDYYFNALVAEKLYATKTQEAKFNKNYNTQASQQS